jgi:hypothetical protein
MLRACLDLITVLINQLPLLNDIEAQSSCCCESQEDISTPIKQCLVKAQERMN